MRGKIAENRENRENKLKSIFQEICSYNQFFYYIYDFRKEIITYIDEVLPKEQLSIFFGHNSSK